MNAFCTVVTPSHIHLVKALAKFLEKSGNFETLYVLLVSENDFSVELPRNIKTCKISDIDRDLPKNICWYFDNFELCNALKPFMVRWVFDQGFEKVIFLDADIYAVGSFSPVWEVLNNCSLLLTPHHIHPPSLELTHTDESGVADMGVFNGGFAGWSSTKKTIEMLEWMITRFPVYGFCDRKKGMFVDQKLIPLLLQYFCNDIEISTNPCLNIAWWNCHERNLKNQDGNYLIEDKSVIFFHMSGYRLSSPHSPCSYLPMHQNNAILSNAPWMRHLLNEYSALLRDCSESIEQSSRPFSEFNGIKLTPSLRRILFKKGYLKYKDREVLAAIAINILKKIKQFLFPYRNE